MPLLFAYGIDRFSRDVTPILFVCTAAYQTLVRPQVEYTSTVWSNYSTFASVSSMLNSLRGRPLEDRRADARLILFYKIVYNPIAVPLPQYINHPITMTRHMNPFHFVQIPATASYYKYSFFPFYCSVEPTSPSYPVLPDLE